MNKGYSDDFAAKLGFGFMRLPKRYDGSFDMDLVKRMVDVFLAEGFTYFDTAYSYPGAEEAIREAVVERVRRDHYTLATKLPIIPMEKPEDARNFFETSLARTGAGYFDYYLFHALNASNYEKTERFSTWKYIVDLNERGLIKHIGFSFHGTPDVLDTILTQHPETEFVQLQLNYLDWDDEKVQARLCYEIARTHNVCITVMEPIKGGLLANTPQSVTDLFHSADPVATASSWALRFVASLKGVVTILSGMNSLEQLYDNISTFKNFKTLEAEERDILSRVVGIYRDSPQIPCTGCRYCIDVCPQRIRIPNLIDLYSEYMVFNSTISGRYKYPVFITGAGKASDCVRCRTCEKSCPQKINIADIMDSIVQVFE